MSINNPRIDRKDEMLNPGYTARYEEKEFAADAGPVIRCPHCGGILMEAVVDRVKTRCKYCRKWIYLEKKLDKTQYIV